MITTNLKEPYFFSDGIDQLFIDQSEEKCGFRIGQKGKYKLPADLGINQINGEYYFAGGKDKYFKVKNFEVYGLEFIG